MNNLCLYRSSATSRWGLYSVPLTTSVLKDAHSTAKDYEVNGLPLSVRITSVCHRTLSNFLALPFFSFDTAILLNGIALVTLVYQSVTTTMSRLSCFVPCKRFENIDCNKLQMSGRWKYLQHLLMFQMFGTFCKLSTAKRVHALPAACATSNHVSRGYCLSFKHRAFCKL